MNLGDAAVRPPVGKRMKARAPPPPRPPQPAPRRIFRNVPDGGGSSGGDSKENILRPCVDIHITLPTGYKTTVNVDGRKALMDLLVDLCSQYHLNPAYHTLELLSPDAQHVSFKPNALLGALDISCALIKERVLEDKVVQKPPPKVPEKTVRLVVNYHRCQKAVVRVNPLAPLSTLVPVICQKCEFDPAHVLLLRDNISHHKLDLDKSLSELGIRELYVLDQTLVLQPKMASTPALNYSAESLHSNSQSLSGSEKRGLLGFLKSNRRKSKTGDQSSEDMESLDDDSVVDNADTNINGLSLVASGPCGETRPSTLGQSQSVMNISRMSPKVELKKRRAPAPPPAPTQTMPLASQIHHGSPCSHNQLTKRKAPAPPPTPSPSTPEPVIPTHEPTAAVRGPSIPVPVERILLQAPATMSPADDSASDVSHSIEDSELSGSICSSSSGDNVAGGSCSSSLAEEPLAHQAHVIAAYTISKPKAEPVPIEEKEEAAPHTMTKQELGLSTQSPTSEDTEAALEIKMDEMENNRNSGIAWQHSAHKTVLEKKAEQEVETVSLASNESFADQGYAASEGMAEEPGPVSPSERIQSDVDIMSLNSGSALRVKQSKDSYSDSDEGCATWDSRHSANTQRGHQPVKRQNSYEDDPEITAQIHLTLADLDANLADIIQSDGASDFVDDEIPVSIVDMDIPVTTIDEVPDDDRYSMSEFKATLLCSTQNVIRQSCTPCEAIQNKNNNACLTNETNLNPSSATQKQSQNIKLTGIEKNVSPSSATQKWSKETKLTDDKEQKVVLNPDTKNKAETEDLKSQKDIVSQKPQGHVVHQTVQSVKKIPENRLKPAPMVRRQSTETANEDTRPINRAPATQGKITQSSFSRFGMKTFTVIPPKPAVSQTTKPAGSLVIGAIKIDEQGNMVTKRMITTAPEKHCSPEGATCATESSLGKAKAFWSSAEKQDQSSTTSRGPVVKNKDADVVKPSLVSGVSKLSEKSLPEEALKEMNVLEKNSISVVACKPLIPEPVENSYFTAEKRDLSFLKPSRRTSSQYVASAIAKNNGLLSTKIDSIPERTESNVGVQKQLVYQRFNNEIRPTNTLPVRLHKSATAFKPTESSVPPFAGSKHSQSYLSHVAEKPTGSEQISSVDKGTLHGRDGTKSMDSQSINNKVQPSIYISTHIIPLKSSSEEDSSINKFPDTSSLRQMLTDTTRPPLTKKPELNESDIPSEPNQGNTFGPVKKFKPVVFKPVQKETSLHSSLMEAIQSGEGIESLKKVSDSSSSYIAKNPSFIDVESEYSALLSAIRAPRNSTRLKKTKSGAAKELEQIRKAEEDRNVQIDIISPPTTPPPAFAAPQPPAFSVPPPPPPAPSKPLLVLPAVGNPEVAREALLEAIRSGSGAQRLRKVPVTHTRRQVNGRLGTIQATLPLSHGH
ncbi:protein cordon-bleu-like isoform X3 [Myxocyprinus asiaticus]|uniref:protein cordon-bleu-like isoform X3 n=1 Tax=Myxocyprinus asiaticus TaxID=70543 RepID=UPI002223E8E7|nr:protein cordon-bleu-like isoform X3 [Myxocyprinus asiaticus]